MNVVILQVIAALLFLPAWIPWPMALGGILPQDGRFGEVERGKLPPRFSRMTAPAQPLAISSSHEPERRAPSRQVSEFLETRRGGARRSDRAVHGPDARPTLEVEARHELRRLVAWMTAVAGPALELAVPPLRSGLGRSSYQAITFYAVLSGVVGGVGYFLWRG